jgi:hypothetical protein
MSPIPERKLAEDVIDVILSQSKLSSVNEGWLFVDRGSIEVQEVSKSLILDASDLGDGFIAQKRRSIVEPFFRAVAQKGDVLVKRSDAREGEA